MTDPEPGTPGAQPASPARRDVSRRAFLGVAAGGAAAIGIGGLAAVGAIDVGQLLPGAPSAAAPRRPPRAAGRTRSPARTRPGS